MKDEQLSDAIIYEKLNLLKKDFFGYIERNSDKVDANLPVFYGHVVSAVEKSFPHLSDDSYDEFIDSITFKVLDASRHITDYEYVKRVMVNALRLKRRKNADIGINIVAGLKLLKNGDHTHALDLLKKYARLDAKLGMAVAYCYFILSMREFRQDSGIPLNRRPGEMELLARETLLTLAKAKPPLNRMKQIQVEDPIFLEEIFWKMVFLGLEWFQEERWFIEIGLQNAAMTGSSAMRKRLLDIGAERFYTDKEFLREMYYYRLENRDAGGAAGVVNQLIRQYPDDPEPIYLGLKLSLLTSKKITYQSFRKLANTRGMPPHIIDLFDIAFDLLNVQKQPAMSRIGDFEKEYPTLGFLATGVRYIGTDFFSNDESRTKRAKRALLDMIEQFCIEELKKAPVQRTRALAGPQDNG